jgi:hypothetical protein
MQHAADQFITNTFHEHVFQLNNFHITKMTFAGCAAAISAFLPGAYQAR